MTHDPLCDQWHAQCPGSDHCPPGEPGNACVHTYCVCELIAKVREDQDRRNAAAELTRLGQDMGMVP